MQVRMPFVLLVCLLACTGCGKGQKPTDELVVDLKSSKADDRVAAARLLPGRKGDAEKIVPALVESLSDPGADVRLSAATTLGSYGEQAKAAVSALQTATKDRDPRVRRAAVNALAQIDPSFAPPADTAKPPQK
ncbi:MAG TPA: HEAT repeat domain-containing protein [Pirellulales bacterium]|nr:HEAT repeat domain-containing protein [Pirellulales bacterium]